MFQHVETCFGLKIMLSVSCFNQFQPVSTFAKTIQLLKLRCLEATSNSAIAVASSVANLATCTWAVFKVAVGSWDVRLDTKHSNIFHDFMECCGHIYNFTTALQGFPIRPHVCWRHGLLRAPPPSGVSHDNEVQKPGHTNLVFSGTTGLSIQQYEHI